MTTLHHDINEPPYAPSEEELPYSDGMPMDNERQALQMNLLAQSAKLFFDNRADVYVGMNMFVYFSPDQVRTHDFRGPDVFVVTNTVRRERLSWVTWQEGKAPDVVIEILSPSTRVTDTTVKKEIYATRLRVPEYFWYDPFTDERAGWVLHGTDYLPIAPDAHDGLPSHALGLTLVRWHGVYEDVEASWLRWATPDGALVPTPREVAAQQQARAEQGRKRAEQQRARAKQAEQAAAAARAEAERERRARLALEARLAQLERQSAEGDRPA